MTLVLPHSSASGWECWVEASVHKPLFSSPPLMDLTGPGRSRAAGSPRGCLSRKYAVDFLDLHVLSCIQPTIFKDTGVTVI